MRARSTLPFLAVVLIAASAPAVPAAPIQAHRAQWTLLYYVDADNDREAERLEHLEHMAAVGSSEDVNVIVLIDRNANDNTHVYPEDVAEDGPLLNLGDFTDAKLLKVERGSLTVLQELGEIDMGSPQTLSWFLATGFRSYPAEHYAAVIDDHGGGIIGASWDDSTPPDANARASYLSIPEITLALDAAFAKTGVDKIDLFGFNACLMGNVDVALKLAPYADYLVASEEMTNGRQWNDEAVIRAAAVPGATGADLGRAVADNQDGADFWKRRTYSVLDLRKMGAVEQALASFSNALLDAGRGALSQLGRARARTIHFGLLSPEEDAALFDVGDLIAHLEGVPPGVTTAGNALYEAVRQATVTVVSGPLSQPATGLAIIFPDRPDGFPFDYAPFAAVPEWSDVLDEYYAAGPQPAFASTERDAHPRPRRRPVAGGLGERNRGERRHRRVLGRPDPARRTDPLPVPVAGGARRRVGGDGRRQLGLQLLQALRRRHGPRHDDPPEPGARRPPGVDPAHLPGPDRQAMAGRPQVHAQGRRLRR